MSIAAIQIEAAPNAARPRRKQRSEGDIGALLAQLNGQLEDLHPTEILRRTITDHFAREIALVSSFGAESAVLLHMAAAVDRDIPVIFLDTQMHFFQTIQYRDELVAGLGLANVMSIEPDKADLAREDPQNILHKTSTDACCDLRKVRPNARALAPFGAWITGRKRFQGGLRAKMDVVEYDGVHFKINPLANWNAKQISHYFQIHDLPAHPLVAQNYPSIGCWPCTKAVAPGAEAGSRAGRWSGEEKSECGIHASYDPGI